MIATQNRRTNRREHQPTSANVARAQELLQRELSFISNDCFRDWDRCFVIAEVESWMPAPPPPRSAQAGRHTMPAHLEQMCAVPLLKPDEERQLFLRMNYLKYRANALRSTLRANRPSARKLSEIDLLLEAAEAIRNRIVHANIRLVISLVKQFADERNPFDDLLSEGIACLVRTSEKFDTGRGFRFSTYATRAVRRDIFRYVQRVHRDRTRYTTGAAEALDQQTEQDTRQTRSEGAWRKIGGSVGRLVAELDDRERFIVHARYGFDDVGGKPTFQRLGEILGVSKERVRQLEQRALSKLREFAENEKLEAFA